MTSTAVNGPTVGDLIELSDTGLVIRVEADAQQAGDEFRTGFGKTARDGMHLRAATASQTCDIVVTNVRSTRTCTCSPRASWRRRCRPA